MSRSGLDRPDADEAGRHVRVRLTSTGSGDAQRVTVAAVARDGVAVIAVGADRVDVIADAVHCDSVRVRPCTAGREGVTVAAGGIGNANAGPGTRRRQIRNGTIRCAGAGYTDSIALLVGVLASPISRPGVRVAALRVGGSRMRVGSRAARLPAVAMLPRLSRSPTVVVTAG